MLEIEVIGIDQIALDGERAVGLVVPTAAELERLCALAIASAGIEDGHVAIEFVDAERIQALNREHRDIDQPTDVLSFAVDGDGTSAGGVPVGGRSATGAAVERAVIEPMSRHRHRQRSRSSICVIGGRRPIIGSHRV